VLAVFLISNRLITCELVENSYRMKPLRCNYKKMRNIGSKNIEKYFLKQKTIFII